MTILEARGHGRQKGHTESTAAANTPSIFCPRSKSSWSSPTSKKDKTLQAIIAAARTGRIGDGKIFISHIDDAIRIRNYERGETAISSPLTDPGRPIHSASVFLRIGWDASTRFPLRINRRQPGK